MKIILGSSSKFRQKVFAELGYDFESLAPDIDEKSVRDIDAKKLTIKLAHAKADILLPKISEPSLLVTADQVVVVDGEIREKPESAEEAREFIQSYDDRPIEIVNGIVVTNTGTGKRVEGTDKTIVRFKPIPDKVITQMIEEGDVMYCAGALKVEDPLLEPFVLEIDGTDDSLAGVPKELIRRLMKQVQ